MSSSYSAGTTDCQHPLGNHACTESFSLGCTQSRRRRNFEFSTVPIRKEFCRYIIVLLNRQILLFLVCLPSCSTYGWQSTSYGSVYSRRLHICVVLYLCASRCLLCDRNFCKHKQICMLNGIRCYLLVYAKTCLLIKSTEAIVTFHWRIGFVVNTFAPKTGNAANIVFFGIISLVACVTVKHIPKESRHACDDVKVVIVVEQKYLVLSRRSFYK